MFEDSLVESSGRIRTRSRRYAAGSLLLETVFVAAIVLIPYLYPAALPRKWLNVPLIAPPPTPAAPLVQPRVAAAAATRTELLAATVLAPTVIPRDPILVADSAPAGLNPGSNIGGGNGPAGLLPLGIGPSPAVPRVRPSRPTGPIRVSAGVASGQLIVPIQPHYPAIALATRTQGTVVVAATISTEGRIESLHVVSGPPLLVPAAVEAIQRARYRLWTLNGAPVEVETTISVVFSLGGS